jgi:magnesium-transporting ATPase (P-type)
VLAVAYKPLPAELPKEKGPWSSAEQIEKDLVFLGLLFIIDPERPEVAGVIRRAAFAGIRTVMITGGKCCAALCAVSRAFMRTRFVVLYCVCQFRSRDHR